MFEADLKRRQDAPRHGGEGAPDAWLDNRAPLAGGLEWFDRVGYDADIEGAAAEFGIRPTRLEDWAAGVNWAPA